ncbi:hypothetical protein BJ741DRAFT_615616 [Chytriomyces cf. hyalinus JEL632]|nr:hypothetical protein BJ741DRAFT_615616 [Chytriomyces cf. hyalinus JEL632]
MAAAATFSTSFWGDQDRGLDVLIARMKNGKHITAEIAQVFKERASIEEEFGKRLTKLAKTFTTTEEIGTLRESLDLVKSELETSARAHLDIANEIRLQLEKQTNDFLQQQSAVRKSHHANIERRLKAKAAMYANAQKAGAKYVSKCREVDQMNIPQPNLPPKDAEKLQIRLERAQQQANQNDIEYVSAIERLGDAHIKWEEEFRHTCNEFQRLEEERIDFLRGRLWAYANIISTLCVSDDESCERVRGSLEKCSVAKDLALFLDTSTTGTIVPQPLQYINYYSKTQERTAGPPVTLSRSYAAGEEGPISPPANRSGPLLGNLASSAGSQFGTLAGMFKKNGAAGGENGKGGQGGGFGTLFKKNDPQQNAPRESFGSNGGFGGTGMYGKGVGTGGVVIQAEEEEFQYDPYDFSEKSPPLFQVRVLYDYQSQAFEELTVSRGQIIPVIAKHEDGWWEGVVMEGERKRKGLFPSNFVEPLE